MGAPYIYDISPLRVNSEGSLWASPHGSSSKLPDRLSWALCIEKIPVVGAHSSSARLQIPRILWSLKFYNHVQKSSPIVPNLSQTNPVHDLPTYSFTIHCYITILSTSSYSKLSPPFRFTGKKAQYIFRFHQTCHIPCLAYLPSFEHPNNIWWQAM